MYAPRQLGSVVRALVVLLLRSFDRPLITKRYVSEEQFDKYLDKEYAKTGVGWIGDYRW